jgi:hypothetical protein
VSEHAELFARPTDRRDEYLAFLASRLASAADTLAELGRELASQTPEETASCACSLGLLEKLRPDHRVMLEQVDLADRSLADVAHSA